ncbi:MAG: alpha/beta hydrolase [Pseudomonadota bacterium]|nr:alpha/beta hydrolase [Pseudomonadota bacterium]
MLNGLKHVTQRVKKLQGTAGRLTGHLPTPLQGVMSRSLGYCEQYDGLDSHVQLLLAVRRLQSNELIGTDPVRSRRHFEAEMASIIGTPTAVSAVQDFVMDTPTGKIPARFYSTKPSATPVPLLVFYHGGGFVVGSLNTHDEACRVLCKHAEVAVLSVDYRLAPEHKAPAAVDDCVAAFQWAVANAAKLGIDPKRIAVGGDSAGGNLSAVVCQVLADQASQPAAQLLIYPVTDSARHYPSHDRYSNDLFLSAQDVDRFKSMYVDGSGYPFDHPLISPLYGAKKGLPPAHVVIAAFDVLRDEGELYAQTLQELNVPCTIQFVADQGHGFINITSVNVRALEATIEMAHALKKLLS